MSIEGEDRYDPDEEFNGSIVSDSETNNSLGDVILEIARIEEEKSQLIDDFLDKKISVTEFNARKKILDAKLGSLYVQQEGLLRDIDFVHDDIYGDKQRTGLLKRIGRFFTER